MPDTWGRMLMNRRAALAGRLANKPSKKLYDVDYLLGVLDESRIGGLRFKLDPGRDFLDNDKSHPTPHWANVRELQHAASLMDSDHDDPKLDKWLQILIAPGSSLGGARPKANVLDDHGHPWIAKFPSGNDVVDKGAWEFLAFRLARSAGIKMTDSKIEKIAGKHHTFFTKRFDRVNHQRVQFNSAMTMTGNTEDRTKEKPASYLDLAEFIQYHGSDQKNDLAELWRRIVFNISISNTDDHLRNHGFIIIDNGWRLAPAYDVNPSVDKEGLALNIDSVDNSLDISLAMSVGEYFQLDQQSMKVIVSQVDKAVSGWKKTADEIGITRQEQKRMESALCIP